MSAPRRRTARIERGQQHLEGVRAAPALRRVVAGGLHPVSSGVAVLGIHGNDLTELLDAADRALYRAKHLGRDRVCLSDPGDPLPGELWSTRVN